MNIRRYLQGEEKALWSLLYNTVHNVNIKDYSQSQIDAWAPEEWDMVEWTKRLLKTNPFVAEIKGQLAGFAEFESNGHIDCFYCDQHWQGKGIGSALLKTIEAEAKKQGLTRIFAESSITAKGFFVNKGFSIEAEQIVSVRGEQFINYVVSKGIQ